MQNITQFIKSFQGEKDEEVISQVFGLFPFESLIVMGDYSAEDSFLIDTVMEEIPFGPEIPCGDTGFAMQSSPNSKVFRVYWPTCEGSSSPCAYVLTEAYKGD